jgi:anti-sigma regulatory factor (Ser/Thr protein kinase)
VAAVGNTIEDMAAVVKHPWYFETDSPQDALAGRPLLERYLYDHTPEGSDLFPAALVYGELVSNVVKHAPHGGVRVWLEPYGTKFALYINDAGRGFGPEAIKQTPDDRSESGRGLFIVRQVCDEISYQHLDGDGFVIRAVLPLRRR